LERSVAAYLNNDDMPLYAFEGALVRNWMSCSRATILSERCLDVPEKPIFLQQKESNATLVKVQLVPTLLRY
jgi:hypothetical protein